tara:strand:- start:30 stop:1067 length:1038 start_codon:yes stop_codon:yes gene_type:complete
MCGGGSTTTTNNVQNNDLPDWAKPYFERNIAKAEAEFSKPYEAYTGERLASTNSLVGDAQNSLLGIADTGISGLGAAQDNALAGMGTAEELGNYTGTGFSEFGYNDANTFTGDAVSQYMSPYMQNVTNIVKDRAVEDFNRLQGSRDAKAVQSGAFGGSRQGVEQGLAEGQVLDRLATIQATGQQQAYADASKQFSAARTADMTVEQRRAAELARIQKGDEASNQFGASQGLAALKVGQGLGSELTRLGELERQTDIQNAQIVGGVGAEQQATEQTKLDLDYATFLEEQGYTREQIGNMTGILSGMPIAATGTATSTGTATTPGPGAAATIAGAGLSGLSLFKAFG